jgi:GH25 family lysozyme M1 (1,4-beta-N-acetylmuramidase)
MEAQLYANTGNPGPQLSRFWPTGQLSPRVCYDGDPNSASCAYNYGWNAAADSYARAVAAYVELGWAEPNATRTPVANAWWLDVEMANSWRSDPTLNVAALNGAVDFLESMEVASVGFYSAPRMWQAITGGTDAFADHPSWVAGASTLRGALAVCRGDGFTGGPAAMAQFFQDGFDANVTCRSHADGGQ